MKYILTEDYRVAKVKNNMVNMWEPKSTENRDWYLYLHPEEHSGFRCIHKDNIILEAPNAKELVRQIKANEKIRAACLKAWNN